MLLPRPPDVVGVKFTKYECHMETIDHRIAPVEYSCQKTLYLTKLRQQVASGLWRVAGYQIRHQEVPSLHSMPAFSDNAIELSLGLRIYNLNE